MTVYLARFCNLSTKPVTANWCVRIYVVYVMAGTCWGCLVVAETSGLSPVTVFRPYTEEIQSLLSFCPAPGTQALVSIGRPTPPPIPDHSRSVTTLYSQIHDYSVRIRILGYITVYPLKVNFRSQSLLVLDPMYSRWIDR
jgi:hypothetical protein